MLSLPARATRTTLRASLVAGLLVAATVVAAAAEAAVVSPSPSPSPSASASAEPSSTASPTASPSPEPSVSPSPTPDAPVTLSLLAAPSPVVIEGDGVSISAPSVVKAGASAAVTFTSDGGQNGTARVWYRTAATWVQSSITFTVTGGVGTATWTPETSRSYRIETTFGVTSPIFSISKEDPQRWAATMRFSATDFASGEMTWLRGYAYKSGATYAKAKVLIERRPVAGTTWSTLATVSTSSAGYYAYRMVATESYVFRARIVNTWGYSGPVSIAALSDSADHTLEQRATDLAWLTGAPKAAITAIPGSVLPSGVNSARYRDYARGTLVEVTTGSVTRTWYLYDRINDYFIKTGRWAGKLGLPLRDMKCGLLEGGCVQRFVGGALYQNSSSTSPGVYAAYGPGVEMEIVATAISQAGYEEPAWRKNKFNTWVDGNSAWCSVFVSWSGAASGNPSMIPKHKTYAGYVDDLKNAGRLHYSGVPPVGAAVLYDWGTGTPTHSGLVRGHPGNDRIATIEGNTTDGSGDPQRGVWLRTRRIADVWAWYIPSHTGQ